MELIEDTALPKTKLKVATTVKKKSKDEALDDLLKELQKEKTEKALSIRNVYDLPTRNQGQKLKSTEKKTKARLKLRPEKGGGSRSVKALHTGGAEEAMQPLMEPSSGPDRPSPVRYIPFGEERGSPGQQAKAKVSSQKKSYATLDNRHGASSVSKLPLRIEAPSHLELSNSSQIIRPDEQLPLYSNSKANNTLSLPSLGQVRRVHHDGLLALDNHYNMREMQSKFSIMENRLRHLENADSRSVKIKQKAEDKAQSMLEARNRHYLDMMNQIKWY